MCLGCVAPEDVLAIQNGALKVERGPNGDIKIVVECDVGAIANADITFECSFGAWVAQSTNMMEMTFDWWSGNETTFCGEKPGTSKYTLLFTARDYSKVSKDINLYFSVLVKHPHQ